MTQVPGGPKIDVAVSGNGAGPATPRYCAFCGQEVVDAQPLPERFGEVFCSGGHAEEFASGVRAARVQAAAAADAVAVTKPETDGPPAPAATPGGWKMALKMAACCGLPILALMVLAGGGGALLGAAGAALPLLAVLACPLGMFFMMRGMMKGGQEDKRPPRDGER
ncbi:MAG: DUF2933 domain-containing protein [Candidatus Rokubacteria bacterium]|nr:DUF2933 domain-containing protein [Candidatus Rokubacteria bacterium]